MMALAQQMRSLTGVRRCLCCAWQRVNSSQYRLVKWILWIQNHANVCLAIAHYVALLVKRQLQDTIWWTHKAHQQSHANNNTESSVHNLKDCTALVDACCTLPVYSWPVQEPWRLRYTLLEIRVASSCVCYKVSMFRDMCSSLHN